MLTPSTNDSQLVRIETKQNVPRGGGGGGGGVPVILTCVLRRHVALTDSLSSLRRFTHFTEGAESVRPQRRAIWLADRCVEIRNLWPLG